MYYEFMSPIGSCWEGDLTGILSTQQCSMPLWHWSVYLLPCSVQNAWGNRPESRGPLRCVRLKWHPPQHGDLDVTTLPLGSFPLPRLAGTLMQNSMVFQDWRQILHLQIAVVLMTSHDPCKENSLTSTSLGVRWVFSYLSQLLKQKLLSWLEAFSFIACHHFTVQGLTEISLNLDPT